MRNFSFRDDSSQTNLELYRKIEDLEGRLQHYQGLVDDYEIKLMEADYGLKDAEVKELNTRINGLLEENSILKEKLSTYETQYYNNLDIVESLNSLIESKNKQILELEFQIKKDRDANKKMGRPSKYKDYYPLIYYLYEKTGSIDGVMIGLASVYLEIPRQQVINILNSKK